jgi:hypothetical protein
MQAHSDSYVVDVLFAMHTPGRGASVIARRLRRLTALALDPYRPELNYMRGPGPKCREKLQKYGAVIQTGNAQQMAPRTIAEAQCAFCSSSLTLASRDHA